MVFVVVLVEVLVEVLSTRQKGGAQTVPASGLLANFLSVRPSLLQAQPDKHATASDAVARWRCVFMVVLSIVKARVPWSREGRRVLRDCPRRQGSKGPSRGPVPNK